MKKLTLIILAVTLILTISACRTHAIDDAYYAQVPEAASSPLTIEGYNGSGTPGTFTLDLSAYDDISVQPGDYLKILVDSNDAVVTVEVIAFDAIPATIAGTFN